MNISLELDHNKSSMYHELDRVFIVATEHSAQMYCNRIRWEMFIVLYQRVVTNWI
jgi:hypothetical protein